VVPVVSQHADAVTVNGLPLHPLIVHATVVALPVTAVLAVVYVVRSAKRDLRGRSAGDPLRLPLMVLGVLSAGLVWVTSVSGRQLRDTLGMPHAVVATHQGWADRLEWTTFAFAVVILLVGFLDQRAGWLRGLLHGLLIAGAVAVVVLCVLTGDAGAKLVWGSIG
jgi:cobalamin synthase